MKISFLFTPMSRATYWLACAALMASGYALVVIADAVDAVELGPVFTLIWALAWFWPVVARMADLRWNYLWAVVPIGGAAWGLVQAALYPNAELTTAFYFFGGLLVLIPFVILLGTLRGARGTFETKQARW